MQPSTGRSPGPPSITSSPVPVQRRLTSTSKQSSNGRSFKRPLCSTFAPHTGIVSSTDASVTSPFIWSAPGSPSTLPATSICCAFGRFESDCNISMLAFRWRSTPAAVVRSLSATTISTEVYSPSSLDTRTADASRSAYVLTESDADAPRTCSATTMINSASAAFSAAGALAFRQPNPDLSLI